MNETYTDSKSNCANAEQSPIAVQIQLQQERIDQLRKHLSVLEGRLSPVSRPQPSEQASTSPCAPVAPRMAVGLMLEMLEGHSKQMQELTARVERIVDRLEI